METEMTLVRNIVWNTDGHTATQAQLPKAVLLIGKAADDAVDALCDHYNWLIESSESKSVQIAKGEYNLIEAVDVLIYN